MANLSHQRKTLAGILFAVSLLVLGYLLAMQSGFGGGLKEKTVDLGKLRPEYVAVSPDGKQIAAMYQERSPDLVREIVGVRDVESGRRLGSFQFAPFAEEKGVTQFHVRQAVRYCDGGKYLLAFDEYNSLVVLDASSLKAHAMIKFSDLLRNLGRERFTFMMNVEVSCASRSDEAVLGFWGDTGSHSLKLIDLDKGMQVADLTGSFIGRYTGDGLAISGDGTKLALVTWNFQGNEGRGIEVRDTRTRAAVAKLVLGDPISRRHKIAFAGDSAVVFGEVECEANDSCEPPLPRERQLGVWEFAKGGAVKKLGVRGTEVYRYFGASADGEVVFGYTGSEKYCKSCNQESGELKIENARFTLWDRASGRVITRSPTLKVYRHTCLPFLHPFGPCSEYEQAPELEMSEEGSAVLAFSRDVDATHDRSTGEVKVYRRR